MPRPGVPVPRGGFGRGEPRSETVGLGEAVGFESGGETRRTPNRGDGVPGRRTVTISGRGAERYSPRTTPGGRTSGTARRPQRRAYERAGFRPDRVAMWAVLLGVMLVVVAA